MAVTGPPPTEPRRPPGREEGARGPATREAAEGALRAEGLVPTAWSNGPGYRYGRHRHDRHKVLFCVAGSIVFDTDQGEVALGPGDRLDLPPRVAHAAAVGPAGVACVEAYRP